MHVILVGGGLANCLIADRLAALRPEVEVTIVEAGPTLGGNHTWSFHASDVSEAQNRWLDPYVVARWPAYDVAFPSFRRRLPLGYRSISSDRLDATVRSSFRAALRLRASAVDILPDRVVLAGGETLAADLVIDGRGFMPSPHMTIAYQKFVGLEFRTQGPHGVEVPMVMDATVPQRDGYRFVYTLPLAPDRLLVEDTYYSDGKDLDAATARGLAERYAGDRGWTIAEVLREERGVLPIGLGGDAAAQWAGADGVPRSGLRAGLFHPTTGYSLPEAVRLADMIARLPDLSTPSVFAATRAHAARQWRGGRFYRLLDRMLFQAADPGARHLLFARFYRLPPAVVARFFAGQSTPLDKAHLLYGKPPVPIGRALRCLFERPPARAAAVPL